MQSCKCMMMRWQHIAIWNSVCSKCGRDMEFNVKMNGEDGLYYVYWNRHPCEVGEDPALLGEVHFLASQTMTALHEHIPEEFRPVK